MSNGAGTFPTRPSTGVAGTLGWKLRRLRTMSLAEVAYRLGQAVRIRFEAAGLTRISAKAPSGTHSAAWLPSGTDTVGAGEVLPRAQAILAGDFDVFALRGARLGFPPEWNRDPSTGVHAPLRFGKLLNYRDPALVGNIKYLWEPSRHLELVTLAQAHVATRDARFADGARTLLDSWFDQCPYPMGPHWSSSLEHAVRLINWSVAWQLLGRSGWLDAPEQTPLRRRWLGEIFRHQAFISRHLSLYSSANNHLLGEYTGLFLAATTWPLWGESRAWLQRARAGLAREVLLQNAPDGVNLEQGLWYHHEVADMMLLCGLAARATGADFPTTYWQRLEDMLVFLASLISVSGNLPMIGDSDDAVMLRLSGASGFDPYRSLLATGAVLFGRSDFALKAGRFDDKSRWLLGETAAPQFERLRSQGLADPSAAMPPRRAFGYGGYWVLGDRFGQADEVRLIADAGPLGYLSIAAHGHADALAFTLCVGGRELLIDPGTYAYHTAPAWRDYFKGTSAHNTVRVDELDQSESGGSFMWLRHANASLLEATFDDARDVWAACHDGYTRLDDPVRHTRRVAFDKTSREITVEDALECRGPHLVEIFWHFADNCVVLCLARSVQVRCGPISLTLEMPGCDWTPSLTIGRESPPLGWMSRSFDEKVPSPTVTWAGNISSTKTLRSVIRVSAA